MTAGRRLGPALFVGGIVAMLRGGAGLGCASVLGVDADEYKDVAAELCKCDELASLGSACAETIGERLSGASESTRAAWLETFDAVGCLAYHTEPTCSPSACSASEECCGFDGAGIVYCHEGRCRREAEGCKGTGAKCASAAECCGSEAGLAECKAGKCIERCSTDAENCPTCCVDLAEGVGGRVCADKSPQPLPECEDGP